MTGALRFVLREPWRLLRPGLWVSLGLMLLLPTFCFLLLAFSPAVFAQGVEWFTFRSFAAAFRGPSAQGILHSLIVGIVTAGAALLCAAGLAWMIHRTTLRARGLWVILIWAVLLMPSYFAALGWQTLLERNGMLARIGIDATPIRHLIFGPVGIVWVLTTKGMPFAYLAVSAGLMGLGREFEDAARVHGARRWASMRVAFTILAPALWSAIAIVFAESISDFGVASTLGAGAHFPLATYTLYLSIASMPIRFSLASVVGWFLIGSAGLALIVQYRALKGRSFAVLSGRTRLAAAHHLGWGGQAIGLAAATLFFTFALGVPALGAIGASFLKDQSGRFTAQSVTLANYHRALTSQELLQPMLLSARMAAITATLAVFFGVLIGRVLSRRQIGLSGRLLDLLLLGAVALPSIVLAAGYIFAYNLPVFSAAGVHLYGTLFLLGMAYLAAALPTTTRLLVGPFAQIQHSLFDAARVHGAGEASALVSTVLPILARGLLWAWLLTFTGTMLELPISQILYPPGEEPLAVGITKHVENYDFAGGSAMMLLAVVGMLAVIGAMLGLFRLLAPRGWQRMKAR